MKKKRIVVIGFIGTQLDRGHGSGRWETWRPSVAMTQHEDLAVDRFELLYSGDFVKLVHQVSADIGAAANTDEDGRMSLTYRTVRSLTLLAAKAAGVEVTVPFTMASACRTLDAPK